MTTVQPKHVGILLIIILVAGVAFAALWLISGPTWQISAGTTGGESTITVTTSASQNPVYTVIIEGWRVRHPISHVSRAQAANDEAIGIETLSWDETMPPGRWTLKVDGVKLDIMPARLVVNDSLECAPGNRMKLRYGELGRLRRN